MTDRHLSDIHKGGTVRRVAIDWRLDLGDLRSIEAVVQADVKDFMVEIVSVLAHMPTKAGKTIEWPVEHLLRPAVLMAMKDEVRGLSGVREAHEWDFEPDGVA